MRIVQISPYSWDAPGGVQVHIRQLSQHLRQRGHDVLVLAPGDARDNSDQVRIVGRPLPIQWNGSVARICLSPASSGRVRRSLREFTPDVIHVHDPLSPSTSMLGVWHANAPVVATFHSYYESGDMVARVYTAVVPLLRPIWKRLAQRIAVSPSAARTVTSRLGDDPVRIVPNGAETELFASARPARLPPGRKMLFVGRLEPRKGFPVALRAFAILAREYPDLRFIVVGAGSERYHLDDLDPQVRARIHMQGRVPDEELPTFHAAADVYISPAIGSESFGIVLIEAMAAGLPVVASDIVGYRDVLRGGQDGILVTPGDADALAAGVRRVLEDHTLAKSLGANGVQRARSFAWNAIVDELESIYGDAVGSDTREREVALVEA
jgi:phosphatidylinositol alpha-mannosyltransferase